MNCTVAVQNLLRSFLCTALVLVYFSPQAQGQAASHYPETKELATHSVTVWIEGNTRFIPSPVGMAKARKFARTAKPSDYEQILAGLAEESNAIDYLIVWHFLLMVDTPASIDTAKRASLYLTKRAHPPRGLWSTAEIQEMTQKDLLTWRSDWSDSFPKQDSKR